MSVELKEKEIVPKDRDPTLTDRCITCRKLLKEIKVGIKVKSLIPQQLKQLLKLFDSCSFPKDGCQIISWIGPVRNALEIVEQKNLQKKLLDWQKILASYPFKVWSQIVAKQKSLRQKMLWIFDGQDRSWEIILERMTALKVQAEKLLESKRKERKV